MFALMSRRAQPVLAEGDALTASDKLDIMELAARFEMALDREDVESFLAVYRDDGVLEGFGAPARGKADLRVAFAAMLNTFARNRRHCSTNAVITGNSQRAVMVSYLTVFNRNDLGRKGSALVTDTAVKENGRWLLAGRRIEVDPSFQLGN
jgi:uncharacterized protein (TIGR02246 family)